MEAHITDTTESRNLSIPSEPLPVVRTEGEINEPTPGLLVVQQILIDVLGRGNMERLQQLVAPTYVGHFWDGDYYGPDGLRIEIASYRNAFTDLTVRLDDLFTCGVHVVRRFALQGTHTGLFHGRAPSGKTAKIWGIGIDRVIDGQLHESWSMTEFAPRAPPT